MPKTGCLFQKALGFNEFSINISTAFGISVCGAQFLTENDFVDKNRASPIWVRN